MALTYTVTGHLEDEDGNPLTGSVIFERKEWLTSSVDGVIPPTEITETIDGSGNISQVLRATNDPQVSPEDWQWQVTIRITGQNDIVGFFLLETDTDLADIFPLGPQPAAPDVFVTRQEFQELEATLGSPASTTYVDDAVAAEATARASADTALDGRLDTAEADIDALQNADILFDGRLDTAEAELALIPTPVGATDGKVLKVASNAFVLDDDETGGGGSGGGMLARAIKDDVSIQTVNHAGTIADYVSADLRVTFDAPASGAVIVWLSSYVRVVTGSDHELYWGVRDLSDVLATDEIAFYVGDARPGLRCTVPLLVTGLTPAAEYTWKWTIKNAATGSGYSAYGGVVGPAMMWVEDATLPA